MSFSGEQALLWAILYGLERRMTSADSSLFFSSISLNEYTVRTGADSTGSRFTRAAYRKKGPSLKISLC